MRPKDILLPGILLLGSGCCTTEGPDDWSWLGGLIGAALGFGLFFLVAFLSSKGRL